MFDLTVIVNFTEIVIKKFFLLPMNNNFENYINEVTKNERLKTLISKRAVNNANSNGETSINLKQIRDSNGNSDDICIETSKRDDLESKLDISYICSRILVCSYPICFSKENRDLNRSLLYKKYYRNGLQELVEFLNMEVGAGNWKLFNLKIEYKSNEDYTDDELYRIACQRSVLNSRERAFQSTTTSLSLKNSHNETRIFDNTASKGNLNNIISLELPLLREGWLDHQPPPLLHLFESVALLAEFLKENTSNVAVIHCKMGKGRSGCLVVAYLIKYERLSLKEALSLFKTSRFKYGLIKGVTIKSQLRFLSYFEFVNKLQENRQNFDAISLLSNRKTKFKLASFEIINPSYLFFGFSYGNCISKRKDKDNYYFEVKLQTYNKNRDSLIDIYCFDIYNKNDEGNTSAIDKNIKSIIGKTISRDTNEAFFDYPDIKISITMKGIKSAIFANALKYLLEKNNGLTVSYWVNLYIETMQDSRYCGNFDTIYTNTSWKEHNGPVAVETESSVTIPFEEADNMSNKIGLFNSSNCVCKLFEAFKVTWSLP